MASSIDGACYSFRANSPSVDGARSMQNETN